jgi:hypothetical protein
MATITKEREARFDETNNYKQGRAGAKVGIKKAAALASFSPKHPNGGEAGGVFRAARGKVK